MSRATKIIAYAGLILCGIALIYGFSQEFAAVNLGTATASRSRMMSYGAGAFFVVIAVGLLAAYDISHFLGNRVEKFIFNDDLDGNFDPEYENAEQVWADGNYLEAIRLMRNYLKKHPSEIHVAFRISEIYEQNMGNILAATLEYEEILKHKLPRERWGWAAIHLCNLYSKLKKTDQAVALLKRIADDYKETAAAKKALERLSQVEPEHYSMPVDPPKEVAESAGTSESIDGNESTEARQPIKIEVPAPKLPPGFRPKE